MPRRLLPARALTVLTILTLALILLSVGLLVSQMRKHALEAARLQTASLAHMLREEVERTFEGADQVLRGVQERMQTPFGTQLPLGSSEVRLLLGSRSLGTPGVDVLAITDTAGQVVNASRQDRTLSSSVAGKPWFAAFSAGTADGLVVAGPTRRPDGTVALELARPLWDARGRLRGAVVLAMDMPQLDQFYRWLHLDEQRPIALYLADGTLLASSPPRADLVGERPPDLGKTPLRLEGTTVRMLSHTAGDGTERRLAVARVGSLPLLVSVTDDEEPALSAWREQSASVVLGAFIVCAFIVVAAGVLSSYLRREVRLARALRDANDRYQRTVDSLMDAIVGVDPTNHITLFNPAAERMFGLRAVEAIGTPVTRLLPSQSRDGHAQQIQQIQQLVTEARPSRAVARGTDLVGLRADGSEFPIEGTIARTVLDGHVELTAVLRDVTDRRRAELALREGNQQLRALSKSLQDVREQERSRIAAELHDELGQQLTGLKLELSWLANRVKDGRALATGDVEGMRQQLDTSIASVRRIATELRPRVLDDRFADAVGWHAAEFARRSGLAVSVDLGDADLVPDPTTATALFRIVQESLTNVARHAQARKVSIKLDSQEPWAVLRIHDDGRGFDPHDGKDHGLGLVGMRERALAVGARLDIRSAPGHGTTIEVRLLIQERATVLAEETA